MDIFKNLLTKNIDCKQFVSMVELMLDNEATDEEKQRFEKHFNKCKPCNEYFQKDKSALELIRKKLRKSTALPPDLADKIRIKIEEML